ncbi:MAG: c-type cytochrome [Pontixanthobacter sp.]
MDDRFNTAAGWVLFAGIIALGLSSVSSHLFKEHRPETMGYPIEVADAGGAVDAGPDLGTLLAAGDVAKGETAAAARCGTCHTFTQGGANGTGPNLWGTLGKKMAGHAGFANYSGDLKARGETWTLELMNEWILNPKGLIPGTAMGFAGLKNNETRADIIVYLNSLGSNLPLPAPKAAEEPAAEGEADAAAETPAEGEAADPAATETPAAEAKPAA